MRGSLAVLLCVGTQCCQAAPPSGGSEERANKEMKLVTNEYSTMNQHRVNIRDHLAPIFAIISRV